MTTEQERAALIAATGIEALSDAGYALAKENEYALLDQEQAEDDLEDALQAESRADDVAEQRHRETIEHQGGVA